MHLLIPQMACIAITLAAAAHGIRAYAGVQTITNLCWAAFNIIMLSGLVVAAAKVRVKKSESVPLVAEALAPAAGEP